RERVLQRRRKVVVNLVRLVVALLDLTRGLTRRTLWERVEARVGVVVRTEDLLDVEPIERIPRDVRIPERAIHVAPVVLLVNRVNRVVVAARVQRRVHRRPREPIRALELRARIEELEVVELGWRAERAKQQ